MKFIKFRNIPQFTQDGNWQADYPIHSFVKEIDRMVTEEGLQLNPDFQRGHIWTEEQQIEYIEFILKGGKTARVIYLNNPSWHYTISKGNYNDFVCVDGLQRITALKRFCNNEIKVFDSYYREYEDKFNIVRHSMRINVNDLKSKKEVLKWYIEFNSGGTPHSKEEIERVKVLLKDCK